MAHYILNARTAAAAQVVRTGLWGVGEDEPHAEALAVGDLVLVYLAAPRREFIGRAEVASVVQAWTAPQAAAYPGDASRGVVLAEVEEWEHPVPMQVVLSRLASEKAKADFDVGVVQIAPREYETVVALARSAG